MDSENAFFQLKVQKCVGKNAQLGATSTLHIFFEMPGREGIYRLHDLVSISQDIFVVEVAGEFGAEQTLRYLET